MHDERLNRNTRIGHLDRDTAVGPAEVERERQPAAVQRDDVVVTVVVEVGDGDRLGQVPGAQLQTQAESRKNGRIARREAPDKSGQDTINRPSITFTVKTCIS